MSNTYVISAFTGIDDTNTEVYTIDAGTQDEAIGIVCEKNGTDKSSILMCIEVEGYRYRM